MVTFFQIFVAEIEIIDYQNRPKNFEKLAQIA